MRASPFAFYPCTATVMAHDLASTDVDSTGDAALADLKRTLGDRGVELLVARSTATVRRSMQVDGVAEALGPAGVFPTVRDAAEALATRNESNSTAPESAQVVGVDARS